MANSKHRAVVSIALALGHSVGAANVELVSRAPVATQITGSDHSGGASFSHDGKFILFSSAAEDLVNLLPPRGFNAFLLEATNNAIEPIAAGANAATFPGGISADNRFVVFESLADNLVTNDWNLTFDIFLRDRQTGMTTLISSNYVTGAPARGSSEYPEISPDGEWVVYRSNAPDLAAGDSGRNSDIFAWKRSDGSTRRVTTPPVGGAVPGFPGEFSLSSDGRFVLFSASGGNYVSPDAISKGEVYWHDLASGATRWVSDVVTNLPGFESASSSRAVLSGNDRFVFLVATPETPGQSVLVRIDLTDDSLQVLAALNQGPANALLYGPAVSEDGMYAVYATGTNVYRWRAETGLIELISAPSAGGTFDNDSPRISHDGSKVAFLSSSPSDAPGDQQLFIHDFTANETTLVTRGASGQGAPGNDTVTIEFSPDGKTLLFDSASDALVAGDRNETHDLFTWNIAEKTLTLLSASHLADPLATGLGKSTLEQNSLSADGRFVAFSSLAKLSSQDTNHNYDVYVRNRVLQTNILVSAGTDGHSLPGFSHRAQISSDGRAVAFVNTAPGLAGGAGQNGSVIYLHNLASGSLTAVATNAVWNLELLQLSGDGRKVFFRSGGLLFRFNRDDGVTSEIGRAFISKISASFDGNRAAFLSNFVVFVRDFTQGVTHRVAAAGGAHFNADGSVLAYHSGTFGSDGAVTITNLNTRATKTFSTPRFSSGFTFNGRFVAFESQASTFAPVVTWLLDTVSTQTVVLHTIESPGRIPEVNNTHPFISADGRFVAFESSKNDLVPGDHNRHKDVFVYDRILDKTTLVSHAAGSASTANNLSAQATISADGSQLAFMSMASDLVPNDLNDNADVFIAALDLSIPAEDSDGDGLDDSWERAAFTTLAFGPDEDFDRDGMTNAQEQRAGTRPEDRASVLKMLRVVPTDLGREIHWSTVPGRRYQLESKPTPETVTWVLASAPLTAIADVTIIVDQNASATGFFRVRLID